MPPKPASRVKRAAAAAAEGAAPLPVSDPVDTSDAAVEGHIDKKQKQGGNTSGGAAAAAGNSASHAAAAAAASAVAVPSAPSASEPLECSLCTHEYECDEPAAGQPSRIPRTLACSHDYCSDCLGKLVKNGRVACPECRQEHEVRLPAHVAAAALSTPADWVRLIPQPRSLLAAIRSIRATKQGVSVAAPCNFCTTAAVHYCADCQLDLCAHHAGILRAAYPDHQHVPLADKAVHQREQRDKKVHTVATRVREMSKASLCLLDHKLAECSKGVRAAQAEVAAAQATWHAAKAKLHQVEEQMAEQTAARVALQQRVDSLTKASDADVLQMSALPHVGGVPVAAVGTQPAVPSSVSDSLILGSLTADTTAHLFRLLPEAKAGMRLLYRASRDGFMPADYWRHCTGKANTLTLVKAAKSGNVFAAFTPVAWTEEVGSTTAFLADPSGRTCLISLVNAHDRPCRLKLRAGYHRAYAVYMPRTDGPGFGVNDLTIMFDGHAANMSNACYCSPVTFELDQQAEREAGLSPLPFNYDKLLLAGVNNSPEEDHADFAAAEIECYQL